MNQRPTYEELEKRIHRLEKAESECRKTMEALRRSEERFRVLFEQANEAIFLHDLDGRFHAANLKACEYLGYSQAELLNLSVADIDPDLVQRKDPKQIWRSLPYRFEGRHLRKDGTLLPVEVSLSMIAFRDQRLILSFVTDISRRRRAEEALEESKSRYKALSEASFEAIFLSDKGTCLDQNQSAQRMFGYTHDEAIGRHGSEWIVPEDRERVIANMMSGYEKPYEVRALRKDGTTFPCEIQARMARMGGRLVRVTALRDISDRKRTEEALRENEEKYRTLFDMESDALALIELDTGRMLEVNKAFVNQYGYSRDEVLTMKNTDFSAEPEETRKATVSRGSYIPVRYHRTKDGTVFPVEISAGVFKYQGRDVHIAAIRDISERMRLEAQVQRSQKMESLGLLAGGVAHDLNNILSGIVSYPELILMDLPRDSKLKKPIETMQDSGYRASAIVEDLLTIARGVATSKQVLDLNIVVKDYLKSPEFQKLQTYHPAIAIHSDLDAALFKMTGSYVHVRKVVMNLVSNASEAIEGSGTVTIRTENCYVDKPLKGYEDVKIDEYVVLSVTDDGIGIPSEEIERIFEPFYTKKVMGRSGTGLGLAIVWNVVQDHEGYIDVQSDAHGTTFKVYFPITRVELADDSRAVPVEAYMGGGESILVVDDMAAQREIACTFLGKLGYRPQAAASGQAAVDYLKDHAVDLVLLDMIMDPGINGRETYARISKLHPGQRAVIVSGFAETEEVKRTQQLGAGLFVKKPYSLEKLGIAIRRELDKGKR